MIDLSYLNETIGKNKEIQKTILQLFLDQLPGFREDIKDLYNNKDFTGIKDLAHKTKNSFEMVGAKEQANILENIESITKENGSLSGLPELIKRIVADSELITKEIEEIII